ncbi:MAG TPA: DUF2127 domain-containing protein [Ktedonobacteraceae bacterium]|nr:DUF2127 domain-containing protein [Ktedonobacteraceae bacterium]
MSRPLGVTIISILLGIQAVLLIVVGLTAVLAGGVSGTGFLFFVGWIPLVIGILSLILAWGLWNLRPWAFWTAVILEALSIINHIFGLGNNGSRGTGGLIISVIILLYLLLDSNVRRAFRT